MLGKKLISIIIPFYTEKVNILSLFKEVKSVLKNDFSDFNYKIILVNDGVYDSGCTLRVYKKSVIDNLYLGTKMRKYIIAISKINGFKIGELQVNHRAKTI